MWAWGAEACVLRISPELAWLAGQLWRESSAVVPNPMPLKAHGFADLCFTKSSTLPHKDKDEDVADGKHYRRKISTKRRNHLYIAMHNILR